MKKNITLLLFFGLLIIFQSNAQHVKVRLNFPAGIAINAPGSAPFKGAVWVGPEWKWNGRQYVHVPGYWTQPKHHKRNRWIPGHWKYSRRGYIWVPGRWH